MTVMKKLTGTLIFLLFFHLSQSQILIALLFGDKLNSGKLEFGLMVGPEFSNLTGVDGELRPGLALGLYFNIKLNDRFYLHPEALPKLSFGAKDLPVYPLNDTHLDSLFATGSVKRTIKAIGLPLLVRYRITGLFFAELGPQINLRTNTYDEFQNKIDDNKLSYEVKNKELYTRFDVGYAVGLAYKISPGVKGMTFGIRYYGGLTDIMKTNGGSQLNRGLFLNIFIPVGAGKAQKKADEAAQQK